MKEAIYICDAINNDELFNWWPNVVEERGGRLCMCVQSVCIASCTHMQSTLIVEQ
jgi:hypothetical protein